MNTTQFIDERNSKIKEEYQKLRLDKSKNRDQHIKELAQKHNLSTSVVWEAIYRSKDNGKKNQA